MITLILKELIKGKSLPRILTNIELRNFKIFGKILDVGGQRNESHYRFLDVKEGKVKTVNIEKKFNPDYLVDIEKEKLSLDDASQDTVFCFNLLEHIADEGNLLREIHRILKEGGILLGSVPFLINVHPDPHDYWRFTAEILQKIFAEYGFRNITIKPIGRGPFTAAYSQIEFVIPIIFRPIPALLVLGFDCIVRLLKPKLELDKKFVLAYIFYVIK
jgi:SAM-dependent methyltransferase